MGSMGGIFRFAPGAIELVADDSYGVLIPSNEQECLNFQPSYVGNQNSNLSIGAPHAQKGEGYCFIVCSSLHNDEGF